MTNKPTAHILAPARDSSVARAAIAAGADAVYIGGPAFGARQAAGNSVQDIAALVRYAHKFGVQVLVTVNTLLTDDERKQAAALAWQLYEIGVDALIIQDMRLLQEALPPIRLHASTQCDNRTIEHILALQKAGFHRAVLARELTIDQIRAIREATLKECPDHPIELEVFVHGALCVCYSGRCYMSEVLMNRSANRGACAQMCRMAYDVLDADGQIIRDSEGQPLKQKYILSLKDMDRSAYLQQLIDAGVTTLKIEGRLKDAAYVTNIVAYYRQLLDHGARQDISYSFTPDPAKTFHRSATDYFLHGRTAGMASIHTPKSTGEAIGIVTSSRARQIHVQLLPDIELHNGDGLCYADRGFQVNTVTPLNGNSVSITTFRDEHVPVGTLLYRNTDTAFLKQLHAERRIPVTLTLRTTPDGFALRMTGSYFDVEQSFAYQHTPAANALKARQTMDTQLRKLGGSDYIATQVILPEADCFIPIGVINTWRRSIVEMADSVEPARPADSRPVQMPQSLAQEQQAQAAPGQQPLMTCKYCILHELGRCRKNAKSPLPEPRYLRLSNGTTVELRFNCKECQMTIHRLTTEY